MQIRFELLKKSVNLYVKKKFQIYISILKAYTEPTANYLHSQPVYPGHQQGVVVQQAGTVTTIVTSQTVQQVGHTAGFVQRQRGGPK